MNVEEIVDVCSVIKIVKDDFVDAVEYIIWCVAGDFVRCYDEDG